MTPSETVSFVEKEMAESRPCPLCGQYGSLGQHQAACPYLAYKGMTSPEESPDGGGQSLQSTNSNADVVSDDEASLSDTPSIVVKMAGAPDEEIVISDYLTTPESIKENVPSTNDD